MSFLPDDLDKQAAAMPTAGMTPSPKTSTSPSSVGSQSSTPSAVNATALLSTDLPSQAIAPRSFSDPSYLMEINDLRGKVKAGTATKDDMKRIIALIRETRGAATPAATSARSKSASSRTSKAKVAKPDGQALLDLL